MSDVGSFYVFSTEGYATLPRDFTTLPAGLAPTKINDHSLYLTLNHKFNDNWKLTAQTAYFNYQQTGSSLWLFRSQYRWYDDQVCWYLGCEE